jgi:hypothetical protein
MPPIKTPKATNVRSAGYCQTIIPIRIKKAIPIKIGISMMPNAGDVPESVKSDGWLEID